MLSPVWEMALTGKRANFAAHSVPDSAQQHLLRRALAECTWEVNMATRVAILVSGFLLLSSSVGAQSGSAEPTCMDSFLDKALGAEQSDLLRTAWSSARNDAAGWADAFYARHGRQNVDEAVARFRDIQPDLYGNCRDLPDLFID
jgi:hypothetical protein